MLTKEYGLRAVRTGLVAGIVGIYVAAIGLVERLDAREFITDILSLGYVLYIVIGVGAGYIVARARKTPEGLPLVPPPATRIATAALTGAVGGAVMLPFLLVIDKFEVRDTFVAIGEGLVEILTFQKSPVVAGFIYIIGGAILAPLGASLHLLSLRYRRTVIAGVATVAFFALMEPMIRLMILGFNDNLFEKVNLDIGSDWLYESGGLTVLGTILCFVLGGAVAYWRQGRKELAAELIAEGVEPPTPPPWRRQASIALLVVVLIALPQIVGRFPSEIIGVVGIYVLLGLGLNIVVGYAGMLDLGYVAFFAIGAYSIGVLTSPDSPKFSPELSFWVALPIAIVITTIAGILIGAPVLRLRGDYLAIVTLGFGEIIRVVVISDWAAPVLGGAQGLRGTPAASVFGTDIRDPDKIYYLILACVLVVGFVAYRVKYARIGRAWNALREDETVAEAMGISIIKVKLMAFGLGAALASFGGAVFAAKIGSLHPNTFTLLVSINVLAVIVLGGMGSIPGVVVGAFVLVGIPEVLREFGEFRLLFYGLILMTLMILKPEGVLPDRRRAEELHEAELDEELVGAEAT